MSWDYLIVKYKKSCRQLLIWRQTFVFVGKIVSTKMSFIQLEEKKDTVIYFLNILVETSTSHTSLVLLQQKHSKCKHRNIKKFRDRKLFKTGLHC